MNIREEVNKFINEGYSDKNAEARVCQDIILLAIAKSPLSRNVTVKGGVVMRSLTQDNRRATQDMDIDFIRYSLSDESAEYLLSSRKKQLLFLLSVGQMDRLRESRV